MKCTCPGDHSARATTTEYTPLSFKVDQQFAERVAIARQGADDVIPEAVRALETRPTAHEARVVRHLPSLVVGDHLVEAARATTELAFEMPGMPAEIVVLVQGLVILFAGALGNMLRGPLARVVGR